MGFFNRKEREEIRAANPHYADLSDEDLEREIEAQRKEQNQNLGQVSDSEES